MTCETREWNRVLTRQEMTQVKARLDPETPDEAGKRDAVTLDVGSDRVEASPNVVVRVLRRKIYFEGDRVERTVVTVS